jgi:hypothetical protein
MAQIANGASRPSAAPGVPDPRRTPGTLAIDLRTNVTTVVGYLELMSDETHPTPAAERLRWIATIERRLEVMRQLNEEVAGILAVLRDVTADQAVPPPVSGAPEG